MKEVRYTRYPETTGIRGYVVNIHDAINYDIDFDFPPGLISRYDDVIKNTYQYRDATGEKVGTTYRCRLKGIKVVASQRPPRDGYLAISRQIDRQNGWIIATVSDVDIYSRLLVTLYDPITSECLSDQLYQNGLEKQYCRYVSPSRQSRSNSPYRSPRSGSRCNSPSNSSSGSRISGVSSSPLSRTSALELR